MRAAADKKGAATRRRRGGQGATRRRTGGQRAPRPPAVWVNRALILVGVAVVFSAAGWAAVTLRDLPVRRITVTGELEHTQAEAVQEMVQSSLAGGFLGADLQHMRGQLERLPWIHEATVRRRWPSTLEIHVVEQLPIARWGEDGFLNHEGGIFTSDRAGDWDSLPLLSGPAGSAPGLMSQYLRLVDMLAPLGLRVEQLSMDARGEVDAVLAGGMRLALGSEEFRERMLRFVAIYRRELAPHAQEIERVDLRYPSGLAVALRESSQVAGL